ncbi:hypothetical protein [Sulfurovum sp.]|uniref:hypothetical protein n=1 Tax=Sulfurovum sp. TaxID=1969726 RepID=UPI003563D593
MKVVFCIPTMTRPYQETLDSLAASVPLFDEAGIEHAMVSEIGCPYISNARATMLRKALDAGADVIVFIDHDVSWDAGDLLKLVLTKGNVVAGTYRFKRDEESYMGHILSYKDGTPMVREEDGALHSFDAPAGFLKITKEAVNKIYTSFPGLVYGDKYHPSIDLFNHGAHKGTWYGEDYAFCRRWLECGDGLFTVPDMNINHHAGDKVYKGNLHEFLLKQPGGSNDTNGAS